MLMNTTFLGDSFSIKWQSRVGDTVKLTRIRPLGAKEVNEIYQMAM